MARVNRNGEVIDGLDQSYTLEVTGNATRVTQQDSVPWDAVVRLGTKSDQLKSTRGLDLSASSLIGFDLWLDNINCESDQPCVVGGLVNNITVDYRRDGRLRCRFVTSPTTSKPVEVNINPNQKRIRSACWVEGSYGYIFVEGYGTVYNLVYAATNRMDVSVTFGGEWAAPNDPNIANLDKADIALFRAWNNIEALKAANQRPTP